MREEHSTVTVRQIQAIVADHFQLPEREIISLRRDLQVVWPRHVTVGLACRLTRYSLPRIGKLLGGRDHSTISNSRQRFEERLAADPDAAAEVAIVEDKILSAAPAEDFDEAYRSRDRLLALLGAARIEAGLLNIEAAAIEKRLAELARDQAAREANAAIIFAARRLVKADGCRRIAAHTRGESAASREFAWCLTALSQAVATLAEGAQ